MGVSIEPAQVRGQIELAKQLAASNLLPKQYQQRPENLLWAIQYAESLGVHPMVAVTSIHVIEGKPTASAQLIGGLVRRAGHKLRVTFDRKTMTAVAQIIRADDPSHTFESVWDLDRAKSAGLAGKAVWKQYPDAMLKARAITEVARDAAPESLYGVIYTPEEIGANVDVDGDGEMIVVDAASVDAVEMASDAQVGRIVELAGKLGLTDQQLETGLRATTGVGSLEMLTPEDADTVIARMAERAAKLPAPAETAGTVEVEDVTFDGSEVAEALTV
jgi:hypothetical protein